MPLNKASLKSSIASALSADRPNLDKAAYCEAVASDIADAVDTYVKGATVTVTGTVAAAPGPLIQTSGSLS